MTFNSTQSFPGRSEREEKVKASLLQQVQVPDSGG